MQRPKRKKPNSRPAWMDEDDPANILLEKTAPSIRPLACLSGIDRLGAVYALRMVDGARLYSHFVSRGDIRDHDLMTLVGLELYENPFDNLTPAVLEAAFHRQSKRLEGRGMPRAKSLDDNIARLGKALHMSATECDVLRLIIVVANVSRFADLFRVCPSTPQAFMQLVRHATRRSARQIQKAMGSTGTLRRIGLVNTDGTFGRRRGSLDPEAEFGALMLAPNIDEDALLRHLLRPSPGSTLSLADFGHISEAQLLERYIGGTVREHRKGVNILIHGAPGTGKTEFVRALASACRLELSEVPAEDSDGDPISGDRRLQAYSLAQRLLESHRSQLLMFDEVEDVFGRSSHALGDFQEMHEVGSRKGLGKGWLNQMLESNPVPTFWVSNSIGAIDPAHLRRFDMVVEFRSPAMQIRRRIVQQHFPAPMLSTRGVERLVAMEHLSPALIERAARVVRTLKEPSQAIRDREAEKIATLSLRAMGLESRSKGMTNLPSHYDPAFVNADYDLPGMIEGLRSGRNARLCLYGPPGTGKTALGHHIAQQLGRPILVRRASDIMSKWVGGTERNLAAAFREASEEGAILLIDEADSFLRERSRADHGWEVSHVNEMLTQMEAFDGMFIASTNLIDHLDAASLRRFDFKIRFDYLKRDQRIALFERVLGTTVAENDIDRRRIEQLDRLTPGDVANALRQMDVVGQAPSASRMLELVEAEMRLKPGASKARIGFV